MHAGHEALEVTHMCSITPKPQDVTLRWPCLARWVGWRFCAEPIRCTNVGGKKCHSEVTLMSPAVVFLGAARDRSQSVPLLLLSEPNAPYSHHMAIG